MSYLGDRLHPWLRSLLLLSIRHNGRKKLGRGNLLTSRGSPTIVLKESRMKSSSHCCGTIVNLRQYRWVGLVLAILLLYNPFFAVPHSGSSLEIGHRASHRATVGASELQHFSPIDGWSALPAVDAGAVVVVLPLTELSARFFLALLPLPRFSRQFFGPGLWFRPPPAR